MRLDELAPAVAEGTWGFTQPSEARVYASPEALLADYRPYIRIQRPLVEATYRELMQLIDPEFLRQGERAAELQGVYVDKIPREWAGGRESAFDPPDTMNFIVPSSEHSENGIDYLCLVKFDDWDKIGSDTSLTYKERALMMIWTSNVRLWSSDPSHLFWGYQHLLTVLDSSIYPEARRPVIRNPDDRGIVSKHMNRVLHVLGAHWFDIAAELKYQFGS